MNLINIEGLLYARHQRNNGTVPITTCVTQSWSFFETLTIFVVILSVSAFTWATHVCREWLCQSDSPWYLELPWMGPGIQVTSPF